MHTTKSDLLYFVADRMHDFLRESNQERTSDSLVADMTKHFAREHAWLIELRDKIEGLL